MIRVPSPYPDRAAFPAALVDYAPALTQLHRFAAKTAWLIDADTRGIPPLPSPASIKRLCCA